MLHVLVAGVLYKFLARTDRTCARMADIVTDLLEAVSTFSSGSVTPVGSPTNATSFMVSGN